MISGKRVLVATDFSEGGDEAIRQADAWARADDGELVVTHVVPDLLRNNPLFPQRAPDQTTGLLDAEQAAARSAQDRVVALTGRDPATVRVIIESGPPDVRVVETAERIDATLSVVGASGATGVARLLLGSVASRVVRHAHGPVLVARASAPTGKILAATDFSDPAIPAVAAAASVARARGARLTLLHSVDMLPNPAIAAAAPFGASWVVVPPDLIELGRTNATALLQDLLARVGAEGDIRVAVGNPAGAIVRAAEELPADLVVLGTRGRTGLARMTLGSVAEAVVRSSPCSVLVVRHAS